MALSSITIGDARFRVGRWQGRAELAYLVPMSPAHTLTREALSAARHELLARGFDAIVTAAVAPPERAALLLDDFDDHERLHLLRRDLRTLRHRWRWPRPDGRIHRGTRRDWPDVLTLDEQSFDEFWQLDSEGIEDSMDATPSSRLRLVHDDEPTTSGEQSQVIGYAIAGRGGTQGYLQRLAVHPKARGAGLGSALIDDALRWMRRHGADVAWVNTQESNTNALGLYEHVGFRRETHHLTVLQRDLT